MNYRDNPNMPPMATCFPGSNFDPNLDYDTGFGRNPEFNTSFTHGDGTSVNVSSSGVSLFGPRGLDIDIGGGAGGVSSVHITDGLPGTRVLNVTNADGSSTTVSGYSAS